MSVRERVFQGVLLPAWERGVRGRPTTSLWRDAESRQWLRRGEIAAFQLAELRRLLEHAGAHVPHYRETFAAARFDPRALRSVADLAALPAITKSLVRERYDRFVDARTRGT